MDRILKDFSQSNNTSISSAGNTNSRGQYSQDGTNEDILEIARKKDHYDTSLHYQFYQHQQASQLFSQVCYSFDCFI